MANLTNFIEVPFLNKNKILGYNYIKLVFINGSLKIHLLPTRLWRNGHVSDEEKNPIH